MFLFGGRHSIGEFITSYTMYLLCRDVRQKPLHELVELLTRKLAEDDATFEGADDYSRYRAEFADESEFQDWRNHVACLVLLPADVNRSYQARPYEEKVPHYAKENAYAASLTASMYKHQPQFAAFCKASKLPFRAYETFGKKEHDERCELVLALANQVWSPDRLKEFLS